MWTNQERVARIERTRTIEKRFGRDRMGDMAMKRAKLVAVLVAWAAVCLGCGKGECPVCLQGVDGVSGLDRGPEAILDAGRDTEIDPGADGDTLLRDADAEVLKGQFGAACASNEDCDSGFCVEGVEGLVCTKVCVDECPEGWLCRGMLVGQDFVSLCVPAGANLCKPCKTDMQCGDGKCLEVGGGKYCGRDCSTSACPSGYECREVAGGKQCYPKNGTCDCKVTFAGMERPCVKENDLGRCLGFEVCDPEVGWVGCTASEPKSEECNGVDDDCNGVADDEPAAPGPVCENEVPGVGKCAGQWVCRGEKGWDCVGPEPKKEECNYVDDDCDGAVDEDFKDGSGKYGTLEHCGACGNFCVGKIPFAKVVACDTEEANPQCVVVECQEGYYKASETLCLAQISNLCLPCVEDANCGGVKDKCLEMGGGKFCGRDCAAGSVFGTQCPTGYECVDFGEGVRQCIPETGTCDCTAANAGMTRVCSVSNAYGTCYGTEVCDAALGWVNCTAKTPMAEVCNGLDDDCNGVADDGAAEPPEPCARTWTDPASGKMYTCTAPWQCKEGGSGVTWVCEAKMPGPEVCNYQDDNCDGVVDEDYKVPGTGKYGHFDHCGACGVSCEGAVPNGVAKCDATGAQPRCVVDACDEGYWQASDLACVPFPETLCVPCASDAACQVPGDACVDVSGDGKRYCVWDCSAGSLHPKTGPGGGVCPAGYVCADLGGGVQQCRPQSGWCDCLFGDEGKTRLCRVTNAHGTCLGVETCDPGQGWLGCTALTPGPEVCNGVDDDCNGLTDELYPDVGAVCFAGIGECRRAGVMVCNGRGDGVVCDAVPGASLPETCDEKDNDCDGEMDEDFGDKGKPCSVGVGECLRYGTQVCKADGTGVQCNAVPGASLPETCDEKDNDCDGEIDEDFGDKGKPCSLGVGECLRYGTQVCKADGTGVQCNAVPGVSTPETCDGRDNDCDGQMDEDWPQKGQVCVVGQGECVRLGTLVCNAGGTGLQCTATPGEAVPETCDGKDNDCDGLIDENWPDLGEVCAIGLGECYSTGTWACMVNGSGVECTAPVIPAGVEVCDGRDNDCDGQIDENWADKGKACTAGVGECLRQGVQVCKADGTGIECDAVPGTPASEACDGRDNDCDGQIDENWADKGKACTVGVGECLRQGVQVCKADGTGIECDAVPGTPASEACDGRDNDCDAQVDEDWPQKGQVCSVGVGECARTGTWQCRSDGAGVQCSATAGTPTAETCDGRDNDCDGSTDENWPAKGQACSEGLGECLRMGTWVCLANGQGLDCDATPGNATAETCDGRDNDCDGSTDENWPTKGQVCLVGQGECQRAGTLVCMGDGSGLECNATPGNPAAEACDAKDNDCDGQTDEDWPQKGQVCTVGTGVCLRTGTYVCNAAQNGIVCNATPGSGSAEVCDYLDNDCDGQTDEDFILNGKYYRDTACGNCYTDCTAIYNLPHAYGTCNYSGTPTCQMNCASGYYDLNAVPDDGCEFYLDPDAIYVSSGDPFAADDSTCGLGPVDTGGGRHPCKTITYGLSRAVATGRGKVLVADGLYEETVTLVNGKSLLGGYRQDTWERHVSSSLTVIRGTDTGTHRNTFIASGVTSTTTLEGFVIYGQVNTNIGGNSYAIYVSNSNSNLRILNNVLYAGAGGPGQSRSPGANGLPGVDGQGRNPSNPGAYDAFVTGQRPCNSSNDRWYNNGGQRICGTDDVSGGRGGGNRCPPTGGTEYSGRDGGAGQPGDGALGGAGGAGGDAGDDGTLDYLFYDVVCYLPSNPMTGAVGVNGSPGANGAAGSGCANHVGSVIGGHWVGFSGGDGGAGGNGGGGGGGGAGGGGDSNVPGYNDRLGGHGGGGGSGGCGGSGGQGGGAGGASIAIMIVGGSAPTIQGNVVFQGVGGNGGDGGNGGVGGPGGHGGNGGICTGSCWCHQAAGKGGEGGAGGHGGGGGGGCGGASYGILTSGVSGVPSYCTANTVSGGAGGAGGQGGVSLGNSGAPGTAGIVQACRNM